MEKKLKVLSALAADLNESDILWAVGGSAMLFLRGIVKEFRDIDLLVCEEDVEVAHAILLRHGKQLPVAEDDRFGSKHYRKYEIDGVEIDHPGNTPQVRERLQRLAAECDLIVTGGTDYHGMNSDRVCPVGECSTDEEQLQRLLELIAARRG